MMLMIVLVRVYGDCEQTGRVDSDTPRVCGHTAALTDIKWNPFDDCVIASCSEDTKVVRSVIAIKTSSFDLVLSLCIILIELLLCELSIW